VGLCDHINVAPASTRERNVLSISSLRRALLWLVDSSSLIGTLFNDTPNFSLKYDCRRTAYSLIRITDE
jgi:hypothetical protein